MEQMGRVVEPRAAASLSIADLPERPTHDAVVLVRPTYFDRTYRINPHMGQTVADERATEQWTELRDCYEDLGATVYTLDPDEVDSNDPEARAAESYPDFVFVANHGVPTADGESIVLARMATEERAGEPALFEDWASAVGYETLPAPPHDFEGNGDALWHPNRALLWAGHGIRTDRRAYDDLAERLDATIVPLELVDEYFYHLDTCLMPLDEHTVLARPEAFTEESWAAVEGAFDRILEPPESEAKDSLAANVQVVNGTVVIGDETPETAALLRDAGYDVRTVPTGEFRKAGGSACCLTLPLASIGQYA